MGVLKGKTALVTGTSQGIGAAVSKALIDAGCNVCMHYFRSSVEPEKMERTAESKGQKAVILQADLTEEQEVIRFVKEAVVFFKEFDILVNNTGSLIERRFLPAVETDYWHEVININMTTMMLVTRELFPYLNREEGASIINIASLAGRKGGHPGSLVYSTAKGAVLTWTRSLSN